MHIEILDKKSGITFAKARLNKEQTCQAMSRLARTQCDLQVTRLDRVGKQIEIKNFEVEIELRDKDHARDKVIASCPDGWEADLYLSSQNTFFESDGKQFVRTTIRRWV